MPINTQEQERETRDYITSLEFYVTEIDNLSRYLEVLTERIRIVKKQMHILVNNKPLSLQRVKYPVPAPQLYNTNLTYHINVDNGNITKDTENQNEAQE